MALLYADENFPHPVVDELLQLGHDATTIQARKRGGEAVPDFEVLALATSEGRAVLTLDRRDYIRLHGERPAHAGIIVCTYDPDFAAFAMRIHAAIQSLSDLSGQLIRINRPA